MHYYKRNIGDYAKKAGRLSMLEHGAYTLLIDACYDREQFPTLEEALDWAWARTEAEESAVKFVLSKFFMLENGVYVQKRIKDELDEYKAKADTNARIAKEREEKRKKNKQSLPQENDSPRTVNEPCEKSHESPPNHKPITNNQEPLLNNNNNACEEKSESHLFVVPSRRMFSITQDWKPEPETWVKTLQVSQHLVKPEQFTDYTLAEFVRNNIGKEEKTEYDWQKFYVNAVARGYIKPISDNQKSTTKKPFFQSEQQKSDEQQVLNDSAYRRYVPPPKCENPATPEQVKEAMRQARAALMGGA